MSDAEKIQEVIDAFPDDKFLETLDRERPYNGQPWTHMGVRGKQLVEGLTVRDIFDCYLRACFESSGLRPSEYPKSVFDLPWDEIDPVAVGQNMVCNIEKYMGIYPNTKKFSYEEVMGQIPIVKLDDEEGE